MEKNDKKIVDFRLNQRRSVPTLKYIEQMLDILKNADVCEDEFCLVISGKRDTPGNDIYMASGYLFGDLFPLDEVSKAFWNELMVMDRKTDLDITIRFLMEASKIIKMLKEDLNKSRGPMTFAVANTKLKN